MADKGSSSPTTTDGQRKALLRIGDIASQIAVPTHQHLVPYVDPEELALTKSTRQVLRWLLQKEKLGQDAFLLGPPDGRMRSIAFKFAQLTNREVEYVAISRDSTESDLKQRREIEGGTAKYVDQCCVRAAIHGRILILDGVQSCERNLLPLINNLLENREMALEDGRFLVSPKRYQALLSDSSADAAALADRKLVPVDPKFFVIAIGLPVPPFTGYPLDPPFRSRFQAKFVSRLNADETVRTLTTSGATKLVPAHVDALKRIASVAEVLAANQAEYRLAEFTGDLVVVVKLLHHGVAPIHALDLVYPFMSLPTTDKHSRIVLEGVLRRFGLTHEQLTDAPMPGLMPALRDPAFPTGLVLTPTFEAALMKMHACHTAVGDFCLVGGKGAGKSHLVRHFCASLGLEMLLVPVFKDMSSRELLQRRSTTFAGDTTWVDAPLVDAMLTGRVAVLDGVESLAHGSLATLECIVHNRSVTLPDGRRLVSDKQYARLPAREKALVERIHPSFRLIALARPTVMGSDAKTWLTPEAAALFPFVQLAPLTKAEEATLLQATVPNADPALVDQLIQVAVALQNAHDDVSALAHSVSLRQLIKLAQRMTAFPGDSLWDEVHRVTMTRFAPVIVREQLSGLMAQIGVAMPPLRRADEEAPLSLRKIENDQKLAIGDVVVPIKQDADPLLIPHTLFYENQRQFTVLRDLLKDWLQGEHILLIGNQGVGKNKLVDYLLGQLQRERQYIQLHRDTTVQALTAIPVIKEGVLSYEDSPLVVAARMGHVLVVDEADKAPTHVTAILKSLIEDREMLLGDGRRITMMPQSNLDVVLHPEFRMIVLANRPGFPFLGNDFFRECGDVFASHAIDNPDVPSEVAMLQQYAPNVAVPLLEKLSRAFAELRVNVQDGDINYPYSTREIVHIARHLEQFPDEGLSNVLHNVFDFDVMDSTTRQVVIAALKKHGIPIATQDGYQIQLAVMHPLPASTVQHEWVVAGPTVEARVERKPPALRGGWDLKLSPTQTLTKLEGRNNVFSEKLFSVHLPMETTVLSVAAFDHVVYLIGTNPIQLIVLDTQSWAVATVSLHEYFPLQRGFPALHVIAVARDQLIVVNVDDGTVLVVKEWKIFSMSVALIKGRSTMVGRVAAGPAVAPYVAVIAQEGESHVDVVMVDGDHARIVLPAPVARMHAATGPRILVQSPTSALMLVDVITAHVQEFASTSGDAAMPLAAMHALEDARFLGVASVDQVLVLDVLPARIIAYRVATLENPYVNVDPVARTLLAQQHVVVYPSAVPGQGTAEVLDLGHCATRHVPVELPLPFTAKLQTEATFAEYKGDRVPAALAVLDVGAGCVAVVDSTGMIQVLQVALEQLKTDLHNWRRLIGSDASADRERLDVTIVDDSSNDESIAKQLEALGIGKGKGKGSGEGEGTGDGEGKGSGSGTGVSGEGGSTGATRTSAEALSLEEIITNAKGDKQATASVTIRTSAPATGEITEAIREMHDEAVRQRMAQLEMREPDMKTYQTYKEEVAKEIQQVRQLIESTQRKQKERVWLKNQSTGELDDRKLVEGLVGDTNIYKRRGDEDPTMGSLFDVPKRVIFSFDLSASMFKFNSHDARLQRSIELALLVMQSFRGFENKFRYEIRGHSGDSASLEFVTEPNYPKDEKDELRVLTKMASHAQYCLTGDHTMASIKQAIQDVTKQESDEAFVVVLSDANISQYNIQPNDLAQVLSLDDRVQAYIIFIGTLADQAEQLRKAMPGKAFSCLDTRQLPQIMKRIFTGMVRSNL
ncbi:von Willebrand factor A domain-containing protein 8 [Allomyces arbusculus]|nr:von Willebrand factor A domain-containing protein 8 [Allomyces arbusculus]